MSAHSENPPSPAPPLKGASRRTLYPRVLNLLLCFVFCALAATGLLLALRLPPGSRGGHGLTVLGFDRHGWGDIHTWVSWGFLVLIALHLAVHWRWLWQVAARRTSIPLLLELGAGLALIIIPLVLPLEKRERNWEHNESGGGEGHRRRGNHAGDPF